MSGPVAHGGRLHWARRMFPEAPAPFFDLSTGINPFSYPVPPLPPEAFTRLPEAEDVAALERTAAHAYGVDDPAMVVAAPGTQALIQLLPRLFPQPLVALLAPTYAEHARNWAESGAAVTTVAAPSGFVDAPAAALCNPNNPDGRRWAAADLLATAPRDLLVVDEAFLDLEPDADRLGCAPKLPHPATVVLRSFGKTYGLAGLRLGFALAAPPRAAAIRAALGPWAVSGIAIAAGRAALSDRAWRDVMRARLAQEGAALDACLSDAGLDVIGGTALFRLAAGDAAPALFERLGRAGILVRSFPERPRWLRFGLPGAAESWRRLRAALAGPGGPGQSSHR